MVMMLTIHETKVFRRVDVEAPRCARKAKIAMRIDRLAQGNPGDVAPVGEGVSELRVHFGPGYRVYFGRDGRTVVVLLCGGDKRKQDVDIRKAVELWQEYTSRRKPKPRSKN